MKRLFYIILVLGLLNFNSCHLVQTTRQFNFDEGAFNTAKNKWQEHKLQNYSFTYFFTIFFPVIRGEAFVSDGIGSESKIAVAISHDDFIYESDYALLQEHHKNNFDEYLELFNSKPYSIHLKTVDSIFDLIEQQVIRRKHDYEINKDIERYTLTVEYDTKYGYPTKIYESISYKSSPKGYGVTGDYISDLDFMIKDFKSSL